MGTSHLHRAHFPYSDSMFKLRKERTPPHTIGHDRSFLAQVNMKLTVRSLSPDRLLKFFHSFRTLSLSSRRVHYSNNTTLTASIPARQFSYSTFEAFIIHLSSSVGLNGPFLSHPHFQISLSFSTTSEPNGVLFFRVTAMRAVTSFQKTLQVLQNELDRGDLIPP